MMVLRGLVDLSVRLADVMRGPPGFGVEGGTSGDKQSGEEGEQTGHVAMKKRKT